MKANIRINIGLTSSELGNIPFEAAAHALHVRGFTRSTARLGHSICEDGPEPVLVWSGSFRGCVAEVISALYRASLELGQDCIAVRMNGQQYCTLDALVGPRPYEAFDPSLFVEP